MIRFERMGPESDAILRNLYEHYVHDMSEWLGIQTGADGRFAYDTSSLWQGDFAVYFAKSNDNLAGFAVVASAEKWFGRKAARDVKDFFVLRAHRHKNVANAMAQYIWNQFPAEWLVRVLASNKPALPFWRRAVHSYIGTACEEQAVIHQDRTWVHLRFDNSNRSA